jgi:iron complex outermembrane receptor protein
MKQNTTLLFILLSLFSVSKIFGQQRIVTGKVIAQEDKSPLIGVSVIVKGTNTGTTTTPTGTFKLSFQKGTTLVFSFIGYQSQEVAIPPSGEVNVSLQPAINTLAKFR